ncbi:MAG: hypothetical protein P4L85_24270 [Paludisphaera borealis]|uniref:hypothetical protein n=1 Tax=Paludisphaera borealis TaxID=1387353 RepID=UPI00283DC4A4|nr:hypothetical protein [Paludisphaera borealis]MDR3622489.1 hypothetical protein [Paludisphaera borealis]
MDAQKKFDTMRLAVISLVAVVAAMVLSIAVLVVRLLSLFEPAACLLSTTGGEPISIYNISKIHRGLMLYGNPLIGPHYASTLYNAGFYYVYAATSWVFSANFCDAAIAMRLITLGFAVFGFCSTVRYGFSSFARCAPEAGVDARFVKSAMVAAAACVWFGTLPGWWILSVRPDVGAVAFCASAVSLVLLRGAGRELRPVLLAGVCFAAAWSFKQSAVFLFLAIELSLVLRKRYLQAFVLPIPVVLTVIAFVIGLGPWYRYNAFVATSFSPFHIQNLSSFLVRIPLKGAFPLAAAVMALPMLSRIPWLRADEATTLRTCWWVTLVGSLITCCRGGSEVNYYFEFWTVVGFLAVIQASFIARGAFIPRPRVVLFGIAFVGLAALFSSLVDAGRLIQPDRFGVVRLEIGPEKTAELERVRDRIRRESRPTFCQPGLWGLAWGLPFPAYVYDDYPYFQEPATQRGVLSDGGLAGVFERHHFGLVVLELNSDVFLNQALASGYVREPGWSHIVVLTSPATGTD